jgi:glycosyltransferase involved in cell wall biosynthesis
VDALAAGLRTLVTDRALAVDLVERGLTRAGAFTWTRSAEATEAVYRRVAGPSC